MRITLVLDDDLIERAQRLTGTQEVSALVQQALGELVTRQSTRRLALLGGTEPELKNPER